MTKNNFQITAILIFCLLASVAIAQEERITELKYNYVIKSEILKQAAEVASMRTSLMSADTLFLPFFDDFSANTVWPSQERWSDSSAFINYNFGINPPTLGMATFDGAKNV